MLKANISKMRETEKDFARRDNGFFREIAILDPATGRAIVTARLYMPGTVCRCYIWIASTKRTPYARGTGRAGGGGYHKPSAALGYAIEDAGIQLSGDIDGRGDGLMVEACEAIARAVTGKRRLITHIAHA